MPIFVHILSGDMLPPQIDREVPRPGFAILADYAAGNNACLRHQKHRQRLTNQHIFVYEKVVSFYSIRSLSRMLGVAASGAKADADAAADGRGRSDSGHSRSGCRSRSLRRKRQLVSGLTKAISRSSRTGCRRRSHSFTDEKTNPPVYVGVLMDTSPSTAGKLGFSKEAAANFIYTVVQLRKDKAAFMTFDNEINLRQDFTDKLDLLKSAVDKVKQDRLADRPLRRGLAVYG